MYIPAISLSALPPVIWACTAMALVSGFMERFTKDTLPLTRASGLVRDDEIHVLPDLDLAYVALEHIEAGIDGPKLSAICISGVVVST